MGSVHAIERSLTIQQRKMLEFIGTRADDYYLNLEAFHVVGPLDLDALRQAVFSVVQRHDTIRSTFPLGEQVYRVLPATVDLVDGMFRVDKGMDSVPDALAEGLRWVGSPLALDEQPPLRFWVGQVDATDAVVAIGGHYLVFDAWSFMLFYDDLAAEYRRARSRGAERARPPQYADLPLGIQDAAPAGWSDLFDRPYRRTRELHRRAVTPLGPGRALGRSWRGDDGGIALASRAYRVTPYVLGVAAMLRALSDVLGDSEVILGSAYAGRTTADSTRVIGYLATTVFLGADLAAVAGTAELVQHVNGQLKRWYVAPRTQWQPLLARYRAADLHPVKFAFLPDVFARPSLGLDGVSTERIRPPAPAPARRPFDLLAAHDDSAVTAHLTYRSDAVDDDLAEYLLDRFFVHLGEICAARPGRPSS